MLEELILQHSAFFVSKAFPLKGWPPKGCRGGGGGGSTLALVCAGHHGVAGNVTVYVFEGVRRLLVWLLDLFLT